MHRSQTNKKIPAAPKRFFLWNSIFTKKRNKIICSVYFLIISEAAVSQCFDFSGGGWKEGGWEWHPINTESGHTPAGLFRDGYMWCDCEVGWERAVRVCFCMCVHVYLCVWEREKWICCCHRHHRGPQKHPVGLHQFECVCFIQHSPFFFFNSCHLPARSFSSPLQGLSYYSP